METIHKREGLVCVCAECRKVISVVGSVSAGSEPRVSHGICPACAQRLYGSIFRAGPGPGEPAPGRGSTPPSSAGAG